MKLTNRLDLRLNAAHGSGHAAAAFLAAATIREFARPVDRGQIQVVVATPHEELR